MDCKLRSMKIAIITDRIYPFYIGGYEYLLYHLFKGLSVNYNVNILTSIPDNQRIKEQDKIIKVCPGYKFVNKKNVHNVMDSIRYNLHLRNYIEELNRYDLVILSTIPYFLYGRLLKKITTRRVSIFYEAWYGYLKSFNPLKSRLIRHEINTIVKNSEKIVAISNSTAKSLINNYGAKDVSKIPIGINLPNDSSERKVKFDIGYIGRFSQTKHIEHIIEAVSLLKGDFQNISVGLAGEGSFLPNVRKIVSQFDLEKNVQIIGQVNEDEKTEFLKSIFIFIMPSEREGFSISTLEAMANGAVPVVAKPAHEEVFGVSDFVIDGETGIYFPFGNISKLAESIKILLTERNKYNSLQSNAIQMSKNYSWDKIIKQYEKLINEDSQKPPPKTFFMTS